MTRVDYEVRNGVGTLMSTAGSEDLAKAYVLRNKLRFPDLRVERVVTTVDRQVIYKPRRVAA